MSGKVVRHVENEAGHLIATDVATVWSPVVQLLHLYNITSNNNVIGV